MTNKLTHSFYLFLLFFLFGNTPSTIDAQCPPPGSINFFSQADLVAFGMNYPLCTEISGSVTISGGDIDDLSDLSSITSITGSLRVLSNSMLINIDGLSGLTSIGDFFQIFGNPILENISGLSSLTSIGGFFQISSSPALKYINGLNSLSSIGGFFQISSSPALENINGLSSLTSVTGNFRILSSNLLSSLNGLGSLATIGGDFQLSSNPVLENINDLSSLTSIGGNFQLSSNPALENINGLSGLTSVTGDFRILSSNLLSSLNGLGSLTSIGGDFQISSNSALENINSLSGLTSVTGSIRILSNDLLSSLAGLDNIDPNGITNLQITSNSALSTCVFQNICEYLAVADEGDANISGNLVGSNCQDEVVLDAACLTFLPVELISFSGKSTKDNIVLNWKTTSERNNQGFAIEHSKDGNNWKEIGYQDGQGTSNRSHDYQFIDHQANAGVNYYRLRQIDFDGAFTYFKTIAIHWKNNTKIPMLISPNPVENILSVELPEDIEVSLIQLLDATGQQISVPMLERNNRFTLDCNRLSPGMYMIVVETDLERNFEKFIKK